MSWALDQETFSSAALCTVVWRVIHGQKTDPWERSCMVTWRTEEDSGTSGRLKEMISEEEEEVYCVAKEKASGTLYKFTHDWLHVPRPTAHMTAYFCCGLGDDFMHHFQVHPWLFVVLHEMATGSVSKFTHDLRFVCCVAGDGFMHHVQVHSTQHNILHPAPLWTSRWRGCRRGMYHCINDDNWGGGGGVVFIGTYFTPCGALSSVLACLLRPACQHSLTVFCTHVQLEYENMHRSK